MIPKFGVYRFSIIRDILKCLSLLVALQIAFSNSQNHLQARYYTYFTEKATGLRSPMPNIVLFMALFSATFYSEKFQSLHKVARMLQWTFIYQLSGFYNWHFTIPVLSFTYLFIRPSFLCISKLQMLYYFFNILL